MAQDPSADGGKEITCLIVDDHEVVREGLRLSLSRAPHIRVIGEASDGASAVSLAERRKPDVVIMDVRMPGMDGLEATKHLTAKVPESSVLIFTAYSERSLLSRGLESGAKGYILKEAPHQTLVKAIEKIAAGHGYVDPGAPGYNAHTADLSWPLVTDFLERHLKWNSPEVGNPNLPA